MLARALVGSRVGSTTYIDLARRNITDSRTGRQSGPGPQGGVEKQSLLSISGEGGQGIRQVHKHQSLASRKNLPHPASSSKPLQQVSTGLRHWVGSHKLSTLLFNHLPEGRTAPGTPGVLKKPRKTFLISLNEWHGTVQLLQACSQV